MLLHPNAKVNLGLYVTGRMANGYHTIETVYLPVPLTDELELQPADPAAVQDIFAQEGIPLDCPPEQNLVLRAIDTLRQSYAIPPVAVRLRKNIPSGAGLGGGSSDATFTLIGLRNLFGLNITDRQLEDIARRLGADCPFFVKNRPVLATGTGNVFSPITIRLEGYCLVIVTTGIHSSTAEAYALTTPRKTDGGLAALIADGRPADWRRLLGNDFEDTVFRRYPLLADIKRCLYDSGAHYASLSGSGSALFALYPEIPPRLAEALAAVCPDSRHVAYRL
jgi:4-diphosphocytidyl-2-C-methyl-D-erythritol kinase